MTDIEKWTAYYIGIRDYIKAKEDAHKKAMKDPKEKLDKVAGIIQKHMAEHSVQSLKTKAGTCYLSTKSTASLADPDAFMNYVIENKQFDLLDRRANVTAVKDFVTAHKALPPGVNLSTIETLGVTRASAKPSE